jgi:hypothetical protein
MGFWSGLGNVFKKVGGAALSFVPGGGIAKDILSGVGQMATGAASGSADANLQQQQMQAQAYRDAMQGALGRANIDLDQKRFSLDAPGKRAGAVVNSDLLRNVGDFKMGSAENGWQNSGGLRPSALGSDSREAANLVIAQQLDALRKGPEQFADIQYPEMPKIDGPGKLASILGGIGMGANILGGLGGLKRPAQPGLPQSPVASPGVISGSGASFMQRRRQ